MTRWQAFVQLYVVIGACWAAYNMTPMLFSPMAARIRQGFRWYNAVVPFAIWPVSIAFSLWCLFVAPVDHPLKRSMMRHFRRQYIDDPTRHAALSGPQLADPSTLCYANACLDGNGKILIPGRDDLTLTRAIATCMMTKGHRTDHSNRHACIEGHMAVSWRLDQSTCLAVTSHMCHRGADHDGKHADSRGFEWEEAPMPEQPGDVQAAIDAYSQDKPS